VCKRGKYALPSIKILLIDDDKDYYTLVQKMLARDMHLYSVEWAASYQMAKAIAERKHYDVFLVDHKLGDHNGLDLISELIASGTQAPFVVLTGYSEPDFDLKVLEAGATDYIDKAEIKPNTLRRTIRYAMQRSQDMQLVKASEENYRLLVEDASDGILITDENAQIILVNSTASEMIGYPQEQIIGRPLFEFIKASYKNDRPLHPDTMTAGETVLIEYRLQRRNGELPVEISAKLVSGGRLQCIIRDITQRKQQEARQERYIQQLTILQQVDEELNHMLNIDYVLSLALDAAVRLSAANAGFIGTLENNRIRLAQAIGRYGNSLPGDYLPENAVFQRVLEDQHPRLIPDVSTEPAYVASNKDTRGVMLIPLVSYERLMGILTLETNRPERFTQEAFDFLKLIASRVAMAMENAQLYEIAQDQLARLQELYLQVSELEKLKTDMIRIAAHDLRNPVGVIVGYLELLEWSLGQDITEKQRNQLDSMMRAAQRMEKITTDILSLERIEKLHLDKTQRLMLNAVALEVFEDYKSQAEQKHQVYTLDIDDEALTVQADNAQLREAMANMISNAIKYTPNEGKITVQLKEENDYAVFRVVDTGYGIPADQQAGLFQPFYRAASDETANIEGTGLGLHLVKNIITRHGGRMIFESEYGKGSTFGFRLPLV
jgi:PAS domain S-box-containing protein